MERRGDGPALVKTVREFRSIEQLILTVDEDKNWLMFIGLLVAALQPVACLLYPFLWPLLRLVHQSNITNPVIFTLGLGCTQRVKVTSVIFCSR